MEELEPIRNVIYVTEEGYNQILELIKKPAAPNAKLVKAAADYKKAIKEGRLIVKY